MKIQEIKLSDLKNNKVQPEYRIEKPFLQKLFHSIKEEGLINPILVDENTLEIIDGHRRVECFRLLGFDKITCILVTVKNTAKAWIEVNSKSRPVRRKDYIGIYKKDGGNNIPKSILNDLIEIADVLGKSFIDVMLKNNLSSRTVIDFIAAAEALGINGRKNILHFFNWAYKTKSLFTTTRCIGQLRTNPKFSNVVLDSYRKNIKIPFIAL